MNNYYSLWHYSLDFSSRLSEYRRTSRILYCLFDFNLSVQFPLETPLHKCRLVADTVVFPTTPCAPWQMLLGAYDYDPFAYDVACLGNMFRARYSVRCQ